MSRTGSMNTPGSSRCVALILLLCFVSSVLNRPTTEVTYRADRPGKCCDAGYAFSEDLECVHVDPDGIHYTIDDAWRILSTQHPRRVSTVLISMQGLNCRVDHSIAGSYPMHQRVSSDYCVENMINGTAVLAKCPTNRDIGVEMTSDTGSPAESIMVTRMTTSTTTTTTTTTTTIVTVTSITTSITRTTINGNVANASTNATSNSTDEVQHHSEDLDTVYFWGAQTYMKANLAHVILCGIVVAVYLLVPDLGRNIYNRAVLRHNVCLLLQGCFLMFMGYCDLNDYTLNEELVTFLWIVQQYFTNATVFWLNVICIDMTLSITRFRWLVGSGQWTVHEENRRFLLYSAFAWGGALIPAIVAIVLEFYPGIPDDFPLKPNYRRYRIGPNSTVNVYFFYLPLATLFWNNVLFVFTTYKIIRIQRSTKIATRNQTKALWKKYFLYLQMYLLMGAPWFFGLFLAAVMNNLIILKICRLIWPIIWLLMLATNKKLLQSAANKLRCAMKTRKADATRS